MRAETTSMALRFLDAAFSGWVEGQIAPDDRFIMKVRDAGVTHEVLLSGELLDWEPTAVMAPLRDIPPLLPGRTQAVRVVVTDTGLRVEPLGTS